MDPLRAFISRFAARSWIWPLFALSAALRVALGFANRWANDDHLEVVYRILNSGVLPKPRECWECHHPKLFYLATAGLVKLFSLPPGSASILAAQLLNVALSVGALAFFARFISRAPFSNTLRNLVFATVALNPCWWGISAQATTDSLAIAFALGAFLASHRFFVAPSGPRLVWCAFFCALTSVTKATGAAVIVLCGFNLLLSLLSEHRQAAARILRGRWALGALLFIVPLPVLGGYVLSWRITGDPFTQIMPKYAPPSFLEETSYGRPGVRSVISGYFTFHIADMIAHPWTVNELPAEPLHRTSMPSQLYGRTFATRFESWPPQWATQDPKVLFVQRLALAAGLAPLAVFCVGWAVGLQTLWRRRRSLFSQVLDEHEFLQISGMAATAAIVLALVRVTASYRDYCTMKFIYLLPVLFGFVSVYLEGFRALEARHPAWYRTLAAVLGLLLVVHVVDMGMLLFDLARLPR